MPVRTRTRAVRPVPPVHPDHATHAVHPVHPVHPVNPDAPLRAMRSAFLPAASLCQGDAIVALAKTLIGDRYVFGARVPMANAQWRGPWDCAEFVSWSVYQATGILFGVEPRHNPVHADAFTGYWADQARAALAMIPVEQAARIAGACVLRIPQSGRVGHIVLSDGAGGTVEAHSSATGVIAHTLSGRRWDCGILVPGVHYCVAEDVVALTPPEPMLRYTVPMMHGKRIKALQTCLNTLGFAVGNVDGVFGPQMESAVQAFQEQAGLVADGEVGKATRKALKAKKCKGLTP